MLKKPLRGLSYVIKLALVRGAPKAREKISAIYTNIFTALAGSVFVL